MKKTLVNAVIALGLICFSATAGMTLKSGQYVTSSNALTICGSKWSETANIGILYFTTSAGFFGYIAPNDVGFDSFYSMLLTAKTKGNAIDIWYESTDTKSIGGTTFYGVAYINLH
jgi:hypothetical protein